MSDAIVKCDKCGEPGRRRLSHPAPDHWFFIESIVAHSPHRRVHMVWACSEACRDGLWQRGPGPASIDEASTQRMRAKDGE